MTTFKQSVAAPLPDRPRTPDGALTVGVALPFAWAVLTGAFVAGLLFTLPLFLWLSWKLIGEPPSWRYFLAVSLLLSGPSFFIVACWSWLYRHLRKAVWLVEALLGTDLDGDNRTGEPETILLEARRSNEGGGLTLYRAQLGHIFKDSDQLKDFATGMLAGRYSLSHNGKPSYVDRSQVIELQETLQRMGWISREKTNQPYRLTALGTDMLRELAT